MKAKSKNSQKSKNMRNVRRKLNNQKTFSVLPVVKVVGIGGGGGNAVSRMSRDFVRGVDFIAINTDHQDLDYCNVKHKIYIGKNLTRGLGTGMNPELGRQAAEENRSEISEFLKGADIVFLAAGLGGGTGSGALPVVAEIARQNGALTLAFVTKPFLFEGGQRMRIAEEALMKIKDKVDVLVVISNDKIFSIINKETPILKAFSAIDDVLKNAILGIVEIIAVPGIINLDFADIKSVVQDAGTAVVGVGIASGQNRAKTAVEAALTSPLLECSAEGAKGIVFGVSGGRDMKMTEIYEAAQRVSEIADPGARIIFGTYYDKKLKPGQMKITLIATGLNGGSTTTTLFGQGIRSSLGLGLGLDKPKPTIEIFDKNKEKEEQDLPSNKLNFGKDIFSLVKEKNKDKKEKIEDEKNLTSQKEDLEIKKEEKEEEKDDIWDTPAFLRRKKK